MEQQPYETEDGYIEDGEELTEGYLRQFDACWDSILVAAHEMDAEYA